MQGNVTNHGPDLYDGNYAKCKTPSSISAADMYCYCSQRLHKSSFPYVKILVPAISFLIKHGDRRKKRNEKKYHEATFIPTRSQSHAILIVIDLWNSELAYCSSGLYSSSVFWTDCCSIDVGFLFFERVGYTCVQLSTA